ncbi:hypothetical protein GCM10007913_31830 [Devosia yakushimensis]|uniref:Uncharacterized protein n=1 Tax=Devosia yakushimensis TaxID=470028 RepID=A0ABQ5UGZ3_9HYPH|nr:hypothetical protein GCM10007913_31830 [Devosia yakushimensis]
MAIRLPLKVEPAQHASASRMRMIVLYEDFMDTMLGKTTIAISLRKMSAGIRKPIWYDFQDAGD